MNSVKFSRVLLAGWLCMVFFAAGASAAPILSMDHAFANDGGQMGFGAGAADSALFSTMQIRSGQQFTVAFRDIDDSIILGHYAKGPWKKNEFLRAWQDISGKGDGTSEFVPVAPTVSRLPEPSTFALLLLALLAFAALKRRPAKN